MSAQNKALVLADRIEKERDSTVHGVKYGTASKAAIELRTLHALVVQMREAIAKNQDRPFNSDHPALAKALATADKYLGELG